MFYLYTELRFMQLRGRSYLTILDVSGLTKMVTDLWNFYSRRAYHKMVLIACLNETLAFQNFSWTPL